MFKKLLKIYLLIFVSVFSFLWSAVYFFDNNQASAGFNVETGQYVEKLTLYHKLWNILLPEALEFKPRLLGAVVTARFPSSGYNNFVEGDVIEEEDWNNIEYTIGTASGTYSSSSNSTSSLFYRVVSSTSVNPGHLHTTSGVSGTIAVAQGGTATTTFAANSLVIASGTNAFNSIAPSASDQILTSSGTTSYIFTTLPDCANGTTGKLLYTTSTNVFSCGTDQNSSASFGGDGSLGALSGSTTLDLTGSTTKTFLYSSISLTGNSVVGFSNAATSGSVIILKSSGAVTITCSSAPCVNASGTGALFNQNGFTPLNDISFLRNVSSTKGSASTATTTANLSYDLNTVFARYLKTSAGAGGGKSASPTCTGGGRGGGIVILEVGGDLNFTTADGISVTGQKGINGANAADGQGGCGGGSGGFVLILYNTATAVSGTVNISGGAGGTGGNGTGGGSGTGEDGASGGSNRNDGGGGGAGGTGGGAGASGKAGEASVDSLSCAGTKAGGTAGAGGTGTVLGGGGGGGGGGGAGDCYSGKIAEILD